MRKRIKDLMAKARQPNGLRLPHATQRVVPRKPKGQMSDADIMRLSLREVALSRGIPPGFHRWPTQEEYAQIEVNQRAEREKIKSLLAKSDTVRTEKKKDLAMEKLLQSLDIPTSE